MIVLESVDILDTELKKLWYVNRDDTEKIAENVNTDRVKESEYNVRAAEALVEDTTEV